MSYLQMDKFARITHALTHKTNASHAESASPLVKHAQHFFRPLDVSQFLERNWLSGPIDASFVERFVNGQLSSEECRRIGFREQTSRPELVERTILEVAGTVLACQLAIHYGIAANVAGGTHHAHRTGGAGY
jgi:acetoin utilization deacetylase AcuC-like enzyme